MKKNWFMRIAGVMLVLAMITSCFVGSTFAKYVTRAQGEDNARVAKWGIILTLEGNAFDTQYQTHETGDHAYEGEFSVVSSNEDQVVAPGTSSDDLEQNLVASVVGTPEVATRYILEGDVTDIVLPAGTYTDYTKLVKNEDGVYGYFDTFTLENAYSPVKWNLVISGKGQELNVADALYENLPENLIAAAEAYGLTPEGCSFFSAVEILKKVAGNDAYVNIVEAALQSLVSGGSNFQLEVEDGHFKMSFDFDPNKVMDFTFELSWEWAFENGEELTENIDGEEVGTGIYEFDAADTFLGNWAAVELGQTIDGFVVPDAPASIHIGATLTATAVQID